MTILTGAAMNHEPQVLAAIDLKKNKDAFLIYEIGLLSLKAALSTRATAWPIYSSACDASQRQKVKHEFRNVLDGIFTKYSNGGVTEREHVEYIENLSLTFSADHASALHNGRLRFGVAQKLINIHLKYLWVAGFCPEPLHCPLDGIVRDLASLDYDWISSDSKSEYVNAIARLRKKSAPRSLSVWELQEFRRRFQSKP
jgi:hypothetical protein